MSLPNEIMVAIVSYVVDLRTIQSLLLASRWLYNITHEGVIEIYAPREYLREKFLRGFTNLVRVTCPDEPFVGPKLRYVHLTHDHAAGTSNYTSIVSKMYKSCGDNNFTIIWNQDGCIHTTYHDGVVCFFDRYSLSAFAEIKFVLSNKLAGVAGTVFSLSMMCDEVPVENLYIASNIMLEELHPCDFVRDVTTTVSIYPPLNCLYLQQRLLSSYPENFPIQEDCNMTWNIPYPPTYHDEMKKIKLGPEAVPTVITGTYQPNYIPTFMSCRWTPDST